MLPTFCPPTIWAISLEFYRKLSILAADDFLGACYRKAMTPKKLWTLLFPHISETGRIRFRGVRFQTPNSVSFFGLAEFRGANSVSSLQPSICVQMRTHRVSGRTYQVCRRTQWVLSSETVLSKQYSAWFLLYAPPSFAHPLSLRIF